MFVPVQLAGLFHRLGSKGITVTRAGEEYRCRCPAHDDRGPSLYIRQSEERILLHCKAGCEFEAICDALDITSADLRIDNTEDQVEYTLDDNTSAFAVVDTSCGTAPVEPSSLGATPDMDLRHRVYTALLEHLELAFNHRQNLQQRGLNLHQIQQRGYRSVYLDRLRPALDQLLAQYGIETLRAIPGFYLRDGQLRFSSIGGLLIPVRDLQGRIVALKVRHDHTGSAKYTWASTKDVSCGSPVHVPLGVPTPCETVRLTEGELKTDVTFAISGVPTISAPGVSNWRLTIPVLQQMQARRVRLAFDQDGKPGTLTAMRDAIRDLTRAGFEVVVEWWSGSVAKGIDDLFAAKKLPETINGVEALNRIDDCLHPVSCDVGESAEPEPMAFPLDVYPPALAQYCREVAEATGTPVDFAAATLLTVAGAAIGTSRALCIKSGTWYECPRFYVVGIGEPSSGKTPAMNLVLKPYRELQQRTLSDHKTAMNTFRRAEKERERIQKANQGMPNDRHECLPLVPEEPDPPQRQIVSDATVEGLAPLLEQNPRGLLMTIDEGVGWVRSMNQYRGGKGSDRQFWLSAWSGTPHLVDRKGQQGIPISIPRPFVNVIAGIQPDMLSELADAQGRQDGFVQRLLFVIPRTNGPALWTDVCVAEDSLKAWESALCRLRALELVQLEDGGMGHRAVYLSEEAREVWIAWWNALAEEMRSADFPPVLLGSWGKLRSYAVRIALVLHYLWEDASTEQEKPVEAATMHRMIRLIEYFKSHLRAAFDRLPLSPADQKLLQVLAWIHRQGGEVTARDLVRAKQVTPTKAAKELMRELVARDYGYLESRTGGNGRSVECFVLGKPAEVST